MGALEDKLARKAKMVRQANRSEFRFAVRQYNRCPRCGRARGYMGKFGMCRICFRLLALRGELAGVVKSSW